jgi:RNA polymerase sigma factor (sigma-70 family)
MARQPQVARNRSCAAKKDRKIHLPPVTIYVAMRHDQPLGSTVQPPIDWEAALARHERWLRTVVLARVGEPQVVNDVMQEIALATVRQAAPLADPGKVAPWLYRVAVQQALLYRRTQGRRRRLVERFTRQVGWPEQCSDESDPLQWLLSSERRRLVREALAELPGKDAEVLLLKHTEDWSYRQLAEHLGTSCSAVESRLHRAREKLRSALRKRDLAHSELPTSGDDSTTEKPDGSDREMTKAG